MSSSTPAHLDLAVRSLLHPANDDQLRLSRYAASRYALTEALAERRSAARRPVRTRSVWLRVRQVLTRPRPV